MGVGKFFTGAYYGRYDKTAHFFASAALTAVLLGVLPAWVAAGAAFGVGVLKELYDRIIRRTRIEVGDLAADLLGVALAMGVYAAVLMR